MNKYIYSILLFIMSSHTLSLYAPNLGNAVKWRDIPNAVIFDDKNKAYSALSNFYESPMVIDGQLWRSVEQYYQAQKFNHFSCIKEHIRRLHTDQYGSAAKKAVRYGRKMQQYIDRDWKGKKLTVMLKALRIKFSNNQALKSQLLNTGNQVLVEGAGARDAFYGDGANGRGSNHLGQLLMHVREELRSGRQREYQWHSSGYFAPQATSNSVQ